jgi:mannose-6-phosphate isomerase-like protein (cupin superfamily)
VIAYVGHIEKQTRENTDFRRVLFTGKHAQLVVMCLEPGEQIGDEVHQNVDQFFRIEQGAARFVFNEGSEHLVKRATWSSFRQARTITSSTRRTQRL